MLTQSNSFLDHLCLLADHALRTLTHQAPHTQRDYPVASSSSVLSASEKKHSAALMRINHTGEICAQALYQGQAVLCQSPELKKTLSQAALEEGDHLHWCEKRIQELNSRTSYLDPIFYLGALLIGMMASKNDAWSLGFLAETETQVIAHLQTHLDQLKARDPQTSAVIQQMQLDEDQHRQTAQAHGAKNLPEPIKKLMKCMAKIMVKTTYYF